MIDFKKEIEKYRPVLEIDEIEDDMNGDDIKDIMELISSLKRDL